MTNPENGSRFNRDHPDDLAIVNLGYWDPNADDDTGPPPRHRSNSRLNQRPNRSSPMLKLPGTEEPEAAGDPRQLGSAAGTCTRCREEPGENTRGGPSTAPSVAVDPDAEFSKVEAIPAASRAPSKRFSPSPRPP